MAITAKFLADFDAFVASAKGAEASIKNVETRSASLGTSLEGLKGMASSLLGAFGVGFSIAAVVGFGKEVISAGASIEHMAAQTNLTNTEVQRFQFIAGQTGTSVETLIGATQTLQQRLGDDASGAAGAMKKLGINAGEFRQLTPYDQMITLSDALRGVTDVTTRASIEAGLFGKSWKDVGPSVVSNMRDIGDQAPVMTDQTVKALAEAENALQRFKQTAIVWGGDVVVAGEKAAGWLEKLAYWAAGSHAPIAAFNVDTAFMTEGVDKLTDTIEKTPGQLKAEADALKLAEDATKKADAANEKYLNDIVARYKEVEAAQKTAFATEAGQLAALEAAHISYEKSVQAAGHDTLAIAIADANLGADAKIAALRKSGTYSTATEFQIRAEAAQTVTNLQQQNLESDDNSKAHFQLIADQARIKFEQVNATVGQFSDTYKLKLRDTADAAQLTADSWGTSLDGALDQISAKVATATMTWTQAMSAVDQGLGTMTGTVANAPNTAETRSATQRAWDMGNYYGPVVGGTQQNPRGSGPDWTRLGYEAGGPTVAGLSMLHGGEYVVPKGGALVSGGGGTIVFNTYITQPLGTADAITKAVGTAVMTTLRQSGVRLPVA